MFLMLTAEEELGHLGRGAWQCAKWGMSVLVLSARMSGEASDRAARGKGVKNFLLSAEEWGAHQV